MDNGDEVREFLGWRRARLTPEQAGLGAPRGHRRVAGLRRGEVADLAGVGSWSAAAAAAVMVEAVRDDPAGRLALISQTYYGPYGYAPRTSRSGVPPCRFCAGRSSADCWSH